MKDKTDNHDVMAAEANHAIAGYTDAITNITVMVNGLTYQYWPERSIRIK